VHRFNIGITVNPDQRRKTYKYFSPSWPHFLIIQCGLTVELALEAEKLLQCALKSDKRSISYQKYRNDTRDGDHVASTGGLKKMINAGSISSILLGAPSHPIVKNDFD
jgi:hypothetical protein